MHFFFSGICGVIGCSVLRLFLIGIYALDGAGISSVATSHSPRRAIQLVCKSVACVTERPLCAEVAEAAASFIISSVADCSKQAQQARPFKRDAAGPAGAFLPFWGGRYSRPHALTRLATAKTTFLCQTRRRRRKSPVN